MVERTAEEKKPPGLIQGSNKNVHILVLFIEGGLKVSEVSFCCFVCCWCLIREMITQCVLLGDLDSTTS